MTDNGIAPLRTNRLSLAQRTQQYLLQLIEDGTYHAGEQLPSQNELAAQLGISRPTLREALLNLEQDGIIVSKHGVGTFVASRWGARLEGGLERLDSILDLAARQGRRLGFRSLEVEQVAASQALVERLDIAPSATLTNVRRVIVADEEPVAFMSDFVPVPVLCPADVNATFNGSVLDLLRRQEALDVAWAIADITAVAADPELAAKLEVRRGQALLLMEETLFEDEGRALGWSENFFLPDLFRFHVVRRCCR